jgi:hypothetical protein
VYGLVATAALTLNLDEWEAEFSEAKPPAARKPPEVIRSNWIGR